MSQQKINWEKYKQPIVLEGKNAQKLPEEFLFKKEMESIKQMLEHFNNERSQNNMISRNISIAGERGSGKTSFLKSLKNILEQESYHVFDIIGPELLSANLGITDIFLSMLSTLLKKYSQNIDNNLVEYSKIQKQIKEVTAAISVEKQKDDFFKNGNADHVVLEALTNRVKLDGKMVEILNGLKRLSESFEKPIEDFVLIIDDLDLVKNVQISHFLTEVQRYLDKKLIVIFAYRESQLENSLFEDRYEDNKNLFKEKIIDSGEIFSQIEQFLVKLVPYGNRVKLYEQSDLLNLPISKILESLDMSEKSSNDRDIFELDGDYRIEKKEKSNVKRGVIELTVENWFYKYLHRHTDLYIKPVDTREDTKLFLPRSLRELIQCFEIFSKMKLPRRGSAEFTEIILENLNALEEYKDFKTNSYFTYDNGKIKFLKEWDISQPYKKNKITYEFFYYQSRNQKNDLDGNEYPFDLINREEYNITLGDVLAIIEESKYSGRKLDVNSFHFVYLVKLNYSLYLSKKFFEAIRKSEISKEAYLQTINIRFMPQNFNFLTTKNTKNNTKNNNKNNNNDYILVYNKSLESDSDFQEFIQDFFYSDISAQGDIRGNLDNDFSAFRYRFLYSYKDLKLVTRRKYGLDFFIVSNKEKYINKVISSLDDESNRTKPFVFKNVFNVDLFIRKNYSRQSEKDEFGYALNQINDIISGDQGGKEKHLNFESLTTILYSSNSNSDSFSTFDVLYDDVKKMSSIYSKLKSNSNRHIDDHINRINTILGTDIKAKGYEDLAQKVKEYLDQNIISNDNAIRTKIDSVVDAIRNNKITEQTFKDLETLKEYIESNETN